MTTHAHRWLRAASVLLMMIAVPHTYGLLSLPARGADESAVFAAMDAYRFTVMRSERTHADFYFGFGLLFTVCLAALALVSWQLGSLARRDPSAAAPFIWSLFVGTTGITVLCWSHFFVAPALVSTLSTMAIGFAWWTLPRSVIGHGTSAKR